MNTAELIEARLATLTPISISIRDDSAAHRGHAGAAEGGGHYHVALVSAAFAGKNKLTRHRMVYQTVSDLMPRTIHALSIDAKSPDEA